MESVPLLTQAKIVSKTTLHGFECTPTLAASEASIMVNFTTLQAIRLSLNPKSVVKGFSSRGGIGELIGESFSRASSRSFNCDKELIANHKRKVCPAYDAKHVTV